MIGLSTGKNVTLIKADYIESQRRTFVEVRYYRFTRN